MRFESLLRSLGDVSIGLILVVSIMHLFLFLGFGKILIVA